MRAAAFYEPMILFFIRIVHSDLLTTVAQLVGTSVAFRKTKKKKKHFISWFVLLIVGVLVHFSNNC